MPKTESSSSVLLDFNPEAVNTASKTTASKRHIVRQTPNHLKRDGQRVNSRLIEVQHKKSGQRTTVDLFAEGDYTTILITEPEARKPKKLQINGTHIRVSDGEHEAKFNLYGMRVVEEKPSLQLSLMEGHALNENESFQVPLVDINNPDELPESFSPQTGQFLKNVAETLSDIQKPINLRTSIRLARVYSEIIGQSPVPRGNYS